MACFHFTYHGYGTWMPDREEGFVRRGKGVVPPDVELDVYYRRDARYAEVMFGDLQQIAMIEEAGIAASMQNFRLHCLATESTHVHVLISWRDDRAWMKLRTSIKTSFSRRLCRDFKRRQWFVDYASRKQVKDQEHFDHLVHTYLPSHSGWKWCETRGQFK